LNWLLVALGGGLGAISRYGVDRLAIQFFDSRILGTFVVNISGSFILGLIVSLTTAKIGFPNNYDLLFAMGFCGAYTTFSSITVTSIQLAESGDPYKAIFNIFMSVLVGMMAAWLGLVLGRILS
tara:strand:+ start:411 stop:782 length:372 start_codon:yes stop_codon:yes gene_type:complete